MGYNFMINSLWVVFLLAGIPVLLIWCVTMNRAIDQVSHDMRKMEPGAVWLCMIPVFGFVWNFVVLNAVAEGIAREFQLRGMFVNEPKPGYSMGLTGCIMLCLCIIPMGGIALAIIGLIFLVIHLVRISEYNKVLQQSGRWEYRYHERMAAMRQQQQQNLYNTWQQQPPPYPPPNYQPPQTFAPPPPPPAPPPPSYNPNPHVPPYDPKEKPKNPFE